MHSEEILFILMMILREINYVTISVFTYVSKMHIGPSEQIIVVFEVYGSSTEGNR